MKQRVANLRETLKERPDRVFVQWSSYNSFLKPSYSKLEYVFLLVAAYVENSAVAFRFAGTLDHNDLGHQRISYEGDNLVRIKNGPRSNLVVRPEKLRYEESAVVAGLQKNVKCTTRSFDFNEKRKGDREFLAQIEEMVYHPEALDVINVPQPEMYKLVRDPAQLTPRITGELITRMKQCEGYDSELSTDENFEKLHEHFSIEMGENSFMFPFRIVTGSGITLADMSSVENEVYVVPMDSLKDSSDIFKLDLLKTIRKQAGVK
jgi:hypothetical protein